MATQFYQGPIIPERGMEFEMAQVVYIHEHKWEQFANQPATRGSRTLLVEFFANLSVTKKDTVLVKENR